MTEFKKSILAGMAIGLGCVAYISVENKIAGAFLFSIGLLTICGMKWNLFTGKLCKCQNSIKEMTAIWAGNLVGAVAMVFAYMLSSASAEAAITVSNAKMQKPLYNVFVSGMLCEVCIYIAVIGFKELKSDIGKYLAVVLGVMVFILSGFEHCVADMFYVFAHPSFYGFVFLLVVTAGNIVGGIAMNLMDR